jgi:AbrB family looped-hinge helix DNA binding protein
MKAIVTTMTQRGQVTVPAEVRRLLGLKPRDKVAFEIEDDKVQLAPVKFTLESAFGSVGPATQTPDFKVISRAARDEAAKKAARELETM